MKKYFLLMAFLTFLAVAPDNFAQSKLCLEYPRISIAPTETKKFGDVERDYYGNPRSENVQATYKSQLFNKRTKTTCHKLEFEISFYTPGNKLKTPEKIYFDFSSVSNAPKYVAAGSQKLKITADGAEIYQTDLQRDDTEYYKGKSYGETLSTEFEFAVFEKMARAKKISFTLGKTVFALNGNQLKSLETMYSLIEK